MIIQEKLSEVKNLLLDAAKNRQTIPLEEFHELFGDEHPDNNRYDTLEEASKSLAPNKDAIYSAVLVKSSDGCPGSGFYDIYNNSRRGEFFSIAKHNDIHKLKGEPHHRKEIASKELERVYEHEKNNYSWVDTSE